MIKRSRVALTTVLVAGSALADSRIAEASADRGNRTHADVEGRITDLDTGKRQFLLGGLPVHYADTRDIDLDGQTLSNGLRVEVEGILVNGVLKAREIDLDRR